MSGLRGDPGNGSPRHTKDNLLTHLCNQTSKVALSNGIQQWKDYEKDYHGKPTFRIVTKKTVAVSHHPVSADAMDACGPVGDGLIFKGLTLSMTKNSRELLLSLIFIVFTKIIPIFVENLQN